MNLILIRHGKPDYTDVDNFHYVGHGRDLAKFSREGIQQVEAAAHEKCLEGAQLIISSPYTRALQTAGIISRITQIPFTVETALHEWMPDLSFTYSGPGNMPDILKEMEKWEGEWNPACDYHWESLSMVGQRAFAAVKKYMEYRKIIIVAYETVLQRFVKRDVIPCCTAIEMEFDSDTRWLGYYPIKNR